MDNTTIAVTMNGVTHNITIPNKGINIISIDNAKTITIHFNDGSFVTTSIAPIVSKVLGRPKRIVPLNDVSKVLGRPKRIVPLNDVSKVLGRPKRFVPLNDDSKVFEKGELSYGEALDSIKEKRSCSEGTAKGLLRNMMEKEILTRRREGKKTLYSIANK